MPQTITIRAGDTEPLEFTVSGQKDGAALANLDDLTTAVLYVTGPTNSLHVDGVACTKSSGLGLFFDPVGAKNGGGDAFDVAGTYRAHAKLTWSDGDITRHPADPDDALTVVVAKVNEG